MACNELLVTKHLTDIPDHKWGAATADLTDTPPVVPLLGYFVAGSSESALLAGNVAAGGGDGELMMDMPSSSSSSSSSSSQSGNTTPPTYTTQDEDTLWLVFKWERLLPLAAYPTARQNTPSYKGLLWLVAQPPDPVQLRWDMLRRITLGMLRALCYCHGRGVVHGSVGASSFLLSTFEDHKSEELVVKLTDFGFARMVVGGGGGGGGPSKGVLSVCLFVWLCLFVNGGVRLPLVSAVNNNNNNNNNISIGTIHPHNRNNTSTQYHHHPIPSSPHRSPHLGLVPTLPLPHSRG